MVSSEAESDGSVLSEPPRHDTDNVLNHTNIIMDHAQSSQDKSFGPSDIRAVGSTLASLVSTRGIVDNTNRSN